MYPVLLLFYYMFTSDVEKNSSPKTNVILKYNSLYNKVLIGSFPMESSIFSVYHSVNAIFIFSPTKFYMTQLTVYIYFFFCNFTPDFALFRFFESIYSEYLKCITNIYVN